MVFVADQDDGVFLFGEADRFGVNLGDERAGGIDLDELAVGGLAANFRGNAMGGINHRAAGGDFFNRIDKNYALLNEAIDNVFVVDDFMVDVDRGALEFEDAFDTFDGHVDAGTEAAGVCEEDFHGHEEGPFGGTNRFLEMVIIAEMGGGWNRGPGSGIRGSGVCWTTTTRRHVRVGFRVSGYTGWVFYSLQVRIVPVTAEKVSERDAGRLGLAQRGELPATVRAAFEKVGSVEEAVRYTKGLTGSHYENFSVVSVLLPKGLRQDFCNVYAFCRIADDLGDEVGDRGKALEYLGAFREQLKECYAGKSETAVFVALAATIKRHDIPMKPFDDLIRAFEQDQTVTRYETFEQAVDYCTRSADPVGRIVLYMCGYRDEQRQQLSDKICTALQLINFWQDVRRDILERDRVYLPRLDMERFGVTVEQLREGRVTAGYRELIRWEVDRTEKMFDEG